MGLEAKNTCSEIPSTIYERDAPFYPCKDAHSNGANTSHINRRVEVSKHSCHAQGGLPEPPSSRRSILDRLPAVCVGDGSGLDLCSSIFVFVLSKTFKFWHYRPLFFQSRDEKTVSNLKACDNLTSEFINVQTSHPLRCLRTHRPHRGVFGGLGLFSPRF